MADERRIPEAPKIPPPPPPRAKATKNTEAAVGERSNSASPPVEHQGGARPKEPSAAKGSPESPPPRKVKKERPVPASPGQSSVGTAPSVPLFLPKRYFVTMNPNGAWADSPKKSPAAAAEETTPKKGFFQNVYSRTKDLLSRKKESTYEPLQQQASAPETPIASPDSTPKEKKRSFFSGFFNGRAARSSISPQAESSSSPRSNDSAAAGSREYSRLNDSSLDESREEDPENPDDDPECDRRAAEAASEVTESDLAVAAAAARPEEGAAGGDDVREVCQIRVRGAADIRVAASATTGEVTTCVRTSSERKEDS